MGIKSRAASGVAAFFVAAFTMGALAVPAHAADSATTSSKVSQLRQSFENSNDPLAKTSLAKLDSLSADQLRQMEKALSDPNSITNPTNSAAAKAGDLEIKQTSGAVRKSPVSAKSGTTAAAAAVYDVRSYHQYDYTVFGVVVTRMRVDLTYQTNGTYVTSVPANGCFQSYRNFNPGVVMSNGGCSFYKYGNEGRATAFWNGNIAISGYLAQVQKRGDYKVNGTRGIYAWNIYNA